jgi:cytochrome c oxidase subunit 2
MAFWRFLLSATALAAFVATPLSALAEANPRGAELYDLCAQCHGTVGEGNQVALAPAIAGLELWYVERQLQNFRSGLRGVHAKDTGGLRMYPMSLSLASDEDLKAVAAYVSSLPQTSPEPVVVGGNAAKGAEYFNTCKACHGETGAGNQQMNAPRLVGSDDWYLESALLKYKAGIRGSNPGNANAVMMRGMALSLPDDQAIKDVIAHIQSLD